MIGTGTTRKLTWLEFKNLVEQNGVKNDDYIKWIDVYDIEHLVVIRRGSNRVCIEDSE